MTIQFKILIYVDVSMSTYSWTVTLSYIRCNIHFCMSVKLANTKKVSGLRTKSALFDVIEGTCTSIDIWSTDQMLTPAPETPPCFSHNPNMELVQSHLTGSYSLLAS